MSGFRHKALALMVLFLVPLVLLAAAPQPVGLATSEGHFTAGDAKAKGQATLFEGDAVRSQYFATRVNLKSGSRYVLGSGSEGAVQRDHLRLRSGSVEVVSAGRPSRVTASSLNVTADAAGSAATVFLTGRNLVTVLVRSGEVKVNRENSAQGTTLRAGQVVSFRLDGRGMRELDSEQAVSEITRFQADQIANLTEAAKNYNCLEPRVGSLSRSFAGLSAQFAANQAARSVIQNRVDRGIATPSDLTTLTGLNNGLRTLQRTSASLAADLNNVVFQNGFHHPGPTPSVSPHTHHGHSVDPEHHDQHGHTGTPPVGHHLH